MKHIVILFRVGHAMTVQGILTDQDVATQLCQSWASIYSDNVRSEVAKSDPIRGRFEDRNTGELLAYYYEWEVDDIKAISTYINQIRDIYESRNK